MAIKYIDALRIGINLCYGDINYPPKLDILSDEDMAMIIGMFYDKDINEVLADMRHRMKNGLH